MSTIYLNNPPKPIRPPHSNDCNGHNTSISVGGNGHWPGDGCPCDVAVSKHYSFNYKLNFNQGTNAEFCTSPAILQNTC